MENFNIKSLGDLERGIKQLLLENRCSFSDDDRVLLNDCMKVMQDIQSELKKGKKPDPNLLINLAQLLLSFFNAFN